MRFRVSSKSYFDSSSRSLISNKSSPFFSARIVDEMAVSSTLLRPNSSSQSSLSYSSSATSSNFSSSFYWKKSSSSIWLRRPFLSLYSLSSLFAFATLIQNFSIFLYSSTVMFLSLRKAINFFYPSCFFCSFFILYHCIVSQGNYKNGVTSIPYSIRCLCSSL